MPLLRHALIVFLLSAVSELFGATIDDLYSEQYFQRGVERFYSRQYAAAIQLFMQSLSHQTLNFRSRYFLGASYLSSGYAKKAADEWENLVKLGGGNYIVKQKLNDLYYQLAQDTNYNYTSSYVFSRYYDGIEDGMHKIVRPSFITTDNETDATFISSVETRFVVELDPNGHVLRQYGRKIGMDSEFRMPTGIYLHQDRLYAADYKLDKVFIFSRDGKLVKSIGTHGIGPSNLAGPMGVYVSSAPYLYIVDNGNDRIQKFNLEGNWIQSIGEGELLRPTDIVGINDLIYVSDSMHGRVVVYDTYGNFIESIGKDILIEPRGLHVADNRLFIVDSRQGVFVYDLRLQSLEKLGVDEGRMEFPFDITSDSKGFLTETDFNSQFMAVYIPLELQYVNLGVQISQVWLSQYPDNFIHFRVWDRKGLPVYNLREENILLYEEGTEIPLPRLGSTYSFRKNLYAKFIFDKSIPMKQFEPEQDEAFSGFLTRVTNDLESDVWLDLITVSTNVDSSGRINASYLWPREYIRKEPYAGSAPQNLDRALYDAVTSLLNVNRNKCIILFVSGELSENTFSDYDIDVITTYARQNAVPIYVINYGKVESDSYRRLASLTFGRYYTITGTREILALYDTIKNAPPLEYIISYEGLNLKGLRNYWVNLHLKIQYKGLFGIDDTGYYVPMPQDPGFGGSRAEHTEDEVIKRDLKYREEVRRHQVETNRTR